MTIIFINMNITIDTEKKTITINGEADAQELAYFVCRNNMKEYKVVEKAKLKEFDNLPDWIKEPPTITSPNIWKAYDGTYVQTTWTATI